MEAKGPAALGPPVRLVIGVLSARGNWAQRDAIRATWLADAHAVPPHSILVKFVVGMAADGSSPCRDCSQPDMLQVPIEESYQGLLDKLLHFIVWAMQSPEVAGFHYLMKADDDAYIHLPGLVKALATAPRLRHYRGHVWLGHPVRNSDHKNNLSTRDYPLSELPPYAYGGAYILSQDLVSYIYQNLHFLSPGAMRSGGNVEDVQVGLWMMALGVAPVHDFRFVDAVFCHSLAFVLFNTSPHLMATLRFGLKGAQGSAVNGHHCNLCSQQVHEWVLDSFLVQVESNSLRLDLWNQIGFQNILLGRVALAVEVFESIASSNISDSSSVRLAKHNLSKLNTLYSKNVSFDEIMIKMDTSIQHHVRKISVPHWALDTIRKNDAKDYVVVY